MDPISTFFGLTWTIFIAKDMHPYSVTGLDGMLLLLEPKHVVATQDTFGD